MNFCVDALCKHVLLFLLGPYMRMELLSNVKLLSKVTPPFSIPTNYAWGSQFLNILTNTCDYLSFQL